METIPKSDCENIGFFRKKHGVHGELVLEFEAQFEQPVEASDRFFIELEGLLVPFFITENGFRFKSAKSAIVWFEGVDSESYARRLVGNPAYLFQNEIVDISEETTESYLLDFTVIDREIGEIGTISNVDDFSGNVVLTVNFKGEEIMIPFNEDFLVSIEVDQKTITLKLPEGLIEI